MHRRGFHRNPEEEWKETETANPRRLLLQNHLSQHLEEG